MELSQSSEPADKQGLADIRKLLKNGPTIWFGGKASPADDDQIAVISNGFRLIFRKEDVCGVEQTDKHYALCVPVDANMVVETRHVAKAGGGSCGCKGGTARANRDRFGGDYDVGWFEVGGGCWLKIECQMIGGHRICFITGVICPTNEAGD